ncbi:MAG: FlgD immunoglobulin-like domain containing protein, partial [bacterium]
AGSCNGNRTASSAYEPGSGSTIMSYAGICGSQNLQAHSDDYFVVRSYDQIAAFTQSGAGNACATTTATGNLPPVPVAGYGGLTLPINTPFILEGSATDPDGDAITYCWEEFDLGPAGAPDTPSGNAPIFRSFKAKTSPIRWFPRPQDVRNNVHTLGELLPSYARTLNFRLIARDNLGGVAWNATSFAVDGNSGPFLVTSIGATPWDAGFQRTITWDVAGTDVAPVSCATVNILLSTDDGFTFGTVLLAGTTNDGSANVTVPALPTVLARVMVQAAGNVFFDLNNAPFEITGNATDVQVAASERTGLEIRPNPFAGRASISFALDQPGRASVDVFDAAGRRVAKLLDGERDAGAHVLSWSGRDDAGRRVASGVYFVRLRAQGETRMASVVHRE